MAELLNSLHRSLEALNSISMDAVPDEHTQNQIKLVISVLADLEMEALQDLKDQLGKQNSK